MISENTDTSLKADCLSAPCSACPICGEPLWFYDCWRSCPSCNLEFPDALEDRVEKAKCDEWGLYAFYGRLEELKGRRVKPAQNAENPNFTEDEHVIISEIHSPNSVRIGYLDGFSVGLRGLSDLNLSSLPNDQVLASAGEKTPTKKENV